ncbi:antibiotic biosynthesis monooxygenase family protein [Saccharopolyspora sp. 5N708]|uniref:antibiotic biosynthesis monooxygenase family protein n=1 Tax=Saccharopolyspora sp. 5N708 TaxID=3457424 RepID=UPI003FD3D611
MGHEAPPEATVTFVNRFTLHVPPEEFEEAFAVTSDFMARQPGFLRHTLLRRSSGDGYLNIAQWADEESFQRAVHDPGFAAHAAKLRALCTSEPALYRPRLQRSR